MNDDRTLDSPAAGDDWLDRLLADDASEHRDLYVADDGFTARVMAALPAPVTAPAWRKPVVVALWGVAAVGVRGRDAFGDARSRARGVSLPRRATGVAVGHRGRRGRDRRTDVGGRRVLVALRVRPLTNVIGTHRCSAAR